MMPHVPPELFEVTAAALARLIPAPKNKAVPAPRLTKIRRVGINKWDRSDEECGLFIGSRCRAIGEARRQGVYFYPTFCTLSLPPPKVKKKDAKKSTPKSASLPTSSPTALKTSPKRSDPWGKGVKDQAIRHYTSPKSPTRPAPRFIMLGGFLGAGNVRQLQTLTFLSE